MSTESPTAKSRISTRPIWPADRLIANTLRNGDELTLVTVRVPSGLRAAVTRAALGLVVPVKRTSESPPGGKSTVAVDTVPNSTFTSSPSTAQPAGTRMRVALLPSTTARAMVTRSLSAPCSRNATNWSRAVLRSANPMPSTPSVVTNAVSGTATHINIG